MVFLVAHGPPGQHVPDARERRHVLVHRSWAKVTERVEGRLPRHVLHHLSYP